VGGAKTSEKVVEKVPEQVGNFMYFLEKAKAMPEGLTIQRLQGKEDMTMSLRC